MMGGMSGWAVAFLHHYGYAGMAVSMGLNCVGIPFPSEILMPLSGVAVAKRHLDGLTLGVAVVLGQMAGLLASYGFVRWYAKRTPRLSQGILGNKQIVRLQRQLTDKGSVVVLLALCLPGVHGFAGYAAGLADIALWRFVGLALTGVVVWSAALISLGYVAGDHIQVFYPLLHKAGLIVLLGVGLAWLIWYSRHHRA